MKTQLTTGLCLKDKVLYFLMSTEGNFLKGNDNFEKIIKRNKIPFTISHNRWWR